jgi:uncharacterized protein
MNNQLNTPITHPITEGDIADYLASTPDFFERHAELLAAVHLTSPHNNRSVSLQERQAEMLRDKIKAIERRTMEMIRNGNENTMLSDKLLHWTRTLFMAVDAAVIPALIVSEIRDQFMVPQVAIKLWDVAPAFAHGSFAQGVSDDAKLFASSLTEPFCGLNTGFEVVNWLDAPQSAASVALLPLRAGVTGSATPAFGLLVLASPDAQRFNSTMGTDFLERIAELASAALSRVR